ncbi:hypothetical protein GWO43_14100 [candidate division KSB1 bacterium]|nr:hypothetical protein [candidate division KSB1 bacterium]NIR72349.1 hypothetical protein [candidate division KSB1 bacterium]NIS25055.1 hypothetical protein [candidate division KSB1 bacterium]NIT71976.1 hypothetical protein [candidate division KSB1 bacterium]NIU93601.1 hypothetical protein [candidate division KSB1 bacterium]
MIESSVSKPLHKFLSDLTGEERFGVALHLATKDLVRLKLKEAEEIIQYFEHRYKMDFKKFKKAWEKGEIPQKHSFQVEKDYWEWEAATSDRERLRQMIEKLP